MMVLPFVLGALLVQCLVGSLIGAVILRAACALFNKMFGKEIQTPVVAEKFPAVATPHLKQPVSDSPYAPPMAPLKKASGLSVYIKGVPEPNFGKALAICLIATIISMVFGLILGMTMASLVDQFQNVGVITLQIASAAIGFFTLAAAISLGFPTSFPRALGVSGLFLAIYVVVVVAIGLVVVLVMYLVG